MPWQEALFLLLGVLVGLLLLGLPVAFAFFAVNIVGALVFLGGDAGLMQMVRSSVTALTNYSLAPIPLFILMGELLLHTGVAFRAINAIEQLISRVPGRLPIVSVVGDPILPVYGTTKSGLLGLTRSIAVAYAEDGIRCNAVCPGDMLTPMLERTFNSAPDPAAKRAEMESHYPLKRIADPREAATAVVFLLSDDASFITGSSLVVDGGLTANCY